LLDPLPTQSLDGGKKLVRSWGKRRRRSSGKPLLREWHGGDIHANEKGLEGMSCNDEALQQCG